jgi:hypothetical protein
MRLPQVGQLRVLAVLPFIVLNCSSAICYGPAILQGSQSRRSYIFGYSARAHHNFGPSMSLARRLRGLRSAAKLLQGAAHRGEYRRSCWIVLCATSAAESGISTQTKTRRPVMYTRRIERIALGAMFLERMPHGSCVGRVGGDRTCAIPHSASAPTRRGSSPTLVASDTKPKASSLRTPRKRESRCCRGFVLPAPLQAMVRVYRLVLVELPGR